MTKTFALMLSVLLVTFSGFVNAGDGMPQGSLAKPESLTHFTLQGDLTLSTSVKSVFGRRTSLAPVLLKGEYISVFSDAQGTYYQGPKDCLPNPNPHALFPALDGGLWLPHDGSQLKPKLWFYLKPMPASFRVGLLVRGLDKLTAGNVKKDPADIEDLSFMGDIAVLPYQIPAEGQAAATGQP